MKSLLIAALLFPSAVSAACTIYWDYDVPAAEWIEGFLFYQDGVVTGTVPPDARSALCADVGLVPGPGAITATAFRGADESPQSAPARWTLLAPGVQIIFEVQ